MKKLAYYLVIILFFLGCAEKELKIPKYEQDISVYAKDIKPLDVKIDKFYKKYYMPWSVDSLKISTYRASWANRVYFRIGKYYAENMLPWRKEEVKKIIDSTNFDDYNSIKKYAVTIKNVQVRNLPTDKPFMRNPKRAGEGFAFDYLQNTRLHINTPLLISHFNKDYSWAFVQNPISFGWIKTEELKVLNEKEVEAFENSLKIVILRDNAPLYSNKQEFVTYANLGTVMPYLKEDKDFFYSYVFLKFGAKLEIRIPKSYAEFFPIEFSKKSVLKIANELLAQKYGWGGFMQNRDCSAMTQDFFIPFGVLLPRNSAAQKRAGEYLSLDGLSNEDKERMIVKSGIPFVSLIYLRGHIMLYIGHKNGKVLVMHNMWGIRTKDGDKIGRYIIGRAVVSDLYIGEDLPNVKPDSLIIKRVKGIVIKPN